MGLEVVSFTIKEVRDENDYISNMGRPEIERIKKEANIAAALAARDTQIQQASAGRESAVAKVERRSGAGRGGGGFAGKTGRVPARPGAQARRAMTPR